jgi:hypothetical protein
MIRMRLAEPLVLLGVLVFVLLPGCGLISSDVTALTFELPAKSYAFDTQSLNLPSGNVPRVACGAGQLVMDCCAPPAPAPAPDCSSLTLTCDAGFCTGHKTVTVASRTNLGQEVPQLQSLSGQTLANVFIKKITYTTANNLNVDLPEVTLYLAPDGVTDPAMGMKFGTMPVTPKMSMVTGDVVLDPGAQATFAGYARNFATPFSFIASTAIVVPPDAPVPAGNATITVRGTISAQPSL